MDGKGILFGIGVGPGDPDLLTLKGLKALKESEVVAYPALEAGDSLARSIVAEHIGAKHTELAIRVPMSRDPKAASSAYDKGALAIAEHLELGRNVALLCEGDPMFYGSFMYLHERLFEHFSVEIIPGVSSVMAAAARLNVPLVSRDDAFAILPATLDESLLEQRLGACETAAILKVGRHLEKVRGVLRRLNKDDQSWYIERATMAAEKIIPLSEVSAEAVPYFSLILVGRKESLGR
ncbi:MAG: precorrin-2 C(20)-methyltransferase [Magnetovibrionaceae bacterium]